MNPEQQRIAIAEACGWLKVHGHSVAGIPDYLNDLNAMHDAEKVLILDCVWATYLGELSVVVAEKSLVHATAAQRAEAFLRTIGKWKESK